MLCSECNQNPAILFYKKIENGKESMEGYCYDCAKKKGINPNEVLAKQSDILSKDKVNLSDMTKQFESIFKDLAENINLEDIENIEGAITFENTDSNGDEDAPKIAGAAIPLGSIFSNMFNGQNHKDKEEQEEPISARKKVKVEKKKMAKQNKKKKFLDTYGTNLTSKAKNNELDIIVGRDKEIQRIVQILNRRSKNNPCLIGEPGVGKTAIAQGLAIKIANQNVPAKLLNKEVYLLDMTAVIAGTQFRGQFESRMKGIIDECKEYGNIILVIDEIHNIIGAGDGEHSMNAANILKPALSNGEIQLIGTTTLKEYRKYIEKDSALERRFQQVLVEEPNIDDSIGILEGIKKYYEEYHKVKISSDVIRQAVIMSEKYIHDRFLPDKAIDILDEVCAKASLSLGKNEKRLQEINKKLKVVRNLKNQSIMNQNFEQASNYKKEEYDLEDQKNKLELQFMKVQKPKVITKDMVREVIYLKTKIPIYELGINLNKEMDKLSRDLKSKIMGQDDIVNQLVTFTQKYKSNYLPQRPYSFLFVGGTGLGKTCLIKEYAKTQVPKNSFIRIDMSEYKEEHSISKLIGSPPGYVGYNDQNAIFDKVREYPNSILLLDEIEKAHPAVLKLFLQILDEGNIKDNKGNEIVFKNTLIFMTSNLGSNQKTIGFSGSKKELRNVYLEEYLGVELVNRIDHIWYFHNMDGAIITTIIKSKLDAIKKARNSVKIKFSKELVDEIKSRCDYQKFGARRIDKIIEEEVDAIIIDHLVQGKSEVVIEKLGTS